ncbi:tachykinins [Macrosteles quadrilineatus]|uniref:tachykinins n=1 Tax=Macrosteles quadrilineatus TaxID=74068 RepID=UPI0023E28CF0|nr:tachykinins [Macrosteles quadrilineatus]XP_054262189.1 tachykinins [Macrosteles quadrilineatus]XP_054262197.1 tachykinins [Macrosteles quadrilineatus]
MGLQARWTLGLLYVAGCVWVLQAEDAGVLERRAPAMGFMGMRGKKDMFDDKRAPSMGFAAMRGKKDSFDMADYYSDFKRGAQGMGFMGMRGKKDFDPEYDFDSGLDKRAPSMGFAAMRGKKAPSGFMGMRGKKFDYTDDDFLDDDSWPLDDLDKRAPAAGFFGTRGKKMPQNSGFFGMRGKKGPSGFVGMRGKKGPASGFMGVRGKKDGEDLESLLALLAEQHGERNKRDEPNHSGVPLVLSQSSSESAEAVNQ